MGSFLAQLPALFILLGALACTDAHAPTDTPSRMAPEGAGSDYSSLPPGKGLGMPNWPREWWGTLPMTLAHETASPHEVTARLALARQTMTPIILGPRRKDLTHNGENRGRFNLTRAKASIDRYAAGPLTPDTVAKYAPLIRGWYSIDEPFCASCWDGVAASYADVVEYLRYFRQRIDPRGLVPMILRVSPSKMDDYGDFDGYVDVGWVVYKPHHKLTVNEFLDQEWAIAQRHGWKMIAGMNAEECNGGESEPCTPAQLRDGLGAILRHAGVCASLNWRWSDRVWRDSGRRAVFDDLSALARSLPPTTCRGLSTGGGSTPPPSVGTLARIDVKPDRITCAAGERKSLTATAYDAAGNTLAIRVGFRVTDETVASVVRTGDRTATVQCLRRGSAHAVAGKHGIRDRSPVSIQ